MTRSLTGELNPGSPALDDSTLPLGYRGGGIIIEVVLQAGTYLMSIGYTSSTTHLVCSLIGNVIYSRVSAYSNVVCTFQKSRLKCGWESNTDNSIYIYNVQLNKRCVPDSEMRHTYVLHRSLKQLRTSDESASRTSFYSLKTERFLIILN